MSINKLYKFVTPNHQCLIWKTKKLQIFKSKVYHDKHEYIKTDDIFYLIEITEDKRFDFEDDYSSYWYKIIFKNKIFYLNLYQKDFDRMFQEC